MSKLLKTVVGASLLMFAATTVMAQNTPTLRRARTSLDRVSPTAMP
jgi:hypothetical protein